MPGVIYGPSKAATDLTRTPSSLYVELGGWAVAGAFVRTWALGLQQRPLLERPYLHVLFAAGGAGIGYLLSQWETTQLANLETQRDILVRRRMMRVVQPSPHSH
ncbi:hypothetical protein HDU88_005113 [Geranomyces variabilis]|nr:hypothetical protein HDU88_005113 [Geranomyces variabilis]